MVAGLKYTEINIKNTVLLLFMPYSYHDIQTSILNFLQFSQRLCHTENPSICYLMNTNNNFCT